MKQVPLILWKDMRHLWPQLSLYAILLAAYAWAVPQTWPGNVPNSFLSVFVTLLTILFGLSQFVLITSVVHADRIVGEDQFWITRPYDWWSLLGAKLLFAITCVALPLVLTQWALLHAAALDPLIAKASMGSTVLRLALVIWLPLLVIASVTDSIRTAFTFLAALLVAWAATLQFILSGTESRMSPPGEFALFGLSFGILMLAIVAYQFARRRTAYSRIAIAATLALFLLFTFGVDRQGFGKPVKKLIRSHYAAPSSGSLRLVFGPGPVPYEERGEDLQYLRNFVEVKLPVRLEGLPSDAKILEPNVAVAFLANGIRYAGPWQSASLSEDTIGISLPTEIYDRVAGSEITLHLELIAEEIRPREVKHFVAADRFPGPLNGNCILLNGKVVCRFAYQVWTPIHVEARLRTSACNVQTQATSVEAWLLRMPPLAKSDPVVNETVALHGRICTGDSLTFVEYGSSQRFRLALDVPGVNLRDYRARD